MTATALVATGEAFHEAIGREYYLTGAGHKADPAFQAIYDRFAELQADETLAAAREDGPRALLEWLVDLRVGRRVAALEEHQLLWEQRAVVRAGGREIPWLRVPIELQNTAERDERIALDQARAATIGEGLDALRRDRFHLEHEVLAALGWDDYVAGITELSGIDLDGLGDACHALLTDTADMYRDVLGTLVRRRIGVPLAELLRADVAWAFRAERFDPAFPADRLVATATGQCGELGLDARQGGRIRFDTEDREGKQPRAFCVPVRVPEEVYLVLRPHGGHADYRTFWHELGHALHFASVDAGRPFHERWLGDNSVTEGFAMLFDGMTMDPGWLARYGRLEETGRAGTVRDLVFELAVHELYMLRRYAAKLRYELVLHRSDFTGLGDTYAGLLSEATLFRYRPEDALVDVDPGFYAARYLRAWQLSALLAETLTSRFDADWFRHPRAGSAVQELMSRGQAEPADRLAVEAAGRPPGFGPVVRRLETLLT